jgi:chromosomal replication initiation ATPase DnaA
MSYLPPAAAALAEALRVRGLLGVVERRAAEYHVTVADILGRGITKSVVAARHAVISDLSATGRSAVEVGKLLDRDHTSVLAALKKNARPIAKAVRCPVLAITRVI